MRHHHSLLFGAEIEGSETRFRLWAPSANTVELIVHGRSARCSMKQGSGGWHETTITDAGAGTRYQYRIDNEINVPDPASRFNPDGVHGVSEIIDPRNFEWNDDHWRGRPWHEAVVYELHVGTFTPEGTFDAIIPRLSELAALGINTLELMPVNSFQGARGWGYDGVLPYAPHPAYGRPDALKRLVQAAHQHGMMIMLDVVYNHFGPEGNYLPRYAKEFFTERHHTPWGNAINFEGAAGHNVRQFFIQNALYWINEYRFDGLRIDAVHAMLDDSQPHFIQELSETIYRGPGSERLVHVVLENHHNESRYLRRDRGTSKGCVSQWNDDFHHPLHVLLTDETDGYYEDFADQPLQQLGRALAEGFAFQGEPSAHGGNKARGERSADLPPTSFVSFLQTHDQIGNRAFGERLSALSPAEKLRAAMAILLLAPQVPMLFMGEEYAATQPFLYFCDYTGDLAAAVTRGRRKEFERFKQFSAAGMREKIPDPNDERTFLASRLDWNERKQAEHLQWLEYVQALLRLRQAEIIPLIPDITGGRWTTDDHVLKVAWQLSGGQTLLLVANLNSGPAPALNDEACSLIFSTTPENTQTGNLQAWEVRLLN